MSDGKQSKRALDVAARLAEMEAKVAAAEAKAAAAEKALADAEAKAAKAPAPRGFVELPKPPSFAIGAAKHHTELGKAFDLLLTAGDNGKAYMGIHWDRRWIGAKGSQKPTRGIDATPAEVGYVLTWLAEHPAETIGWIEWAEKVAQANGLTTA